MFFEYNDNKTVFRFLQKHFEHPELHLVKILENIDNIDDIKIYFNYIKDNIEYYEDKLLKEYNVNSILELIIDVWNEDDEEKDYVFRNVHELLMLMYDSKNVKEVLEYLNKFDYIDTDEEKEELLIEIKNKYNVEL